jgi:class 3 adenylate cyclase
MGKFIITKDDVVATEHGNEDVAIIKKEVLDAFNSDVLGLGNINSKSIPVNALAAIFDLEGFTKFCKQIDPQLSVPGFLDQFLNWLFKKIKETCIKQELQEGYRIYLEPPFLSKFLGDGILFLWDTENKTDTEINNIVSSCQRVSTHYPDQFLITVKDKYSYAPTALRCGIARGIVYSVGNGEDFVGPCINLASRLQKLSHLTFAFSRKGFDFETYMPPTRSERYFVKEVQIRGIGDNELVCILKEEYEKLPEEEKKKFHDPIHNNT